MSFASNVKDEIALKEQEYEKDQLCALFKSGGSIAISNGNLKLIYKSENGKVAAMQKIVLKSAETLHDFNKN